jgi:myo-inositol 2-dehydrogenase/D-chiro-inositol 1-dehydrogenase
MPPFRLGLVGAGRMGRTHLRALAGSERVAVTAIAEMSAAAREALAREGDAPGVTLHASPAEMLEAAALDGVLIAAPTDQHGAIIAEVAARGLPILCEKPCGLTAAAARASARTAAVAGVPLQVAYWRRFVPGLRRLHDRIAAGELGVIHLVTCYQWDEQPPPVAFRAHSGGIAIDMGVHEFDQLRWLTGRDIDGLAVVASGQAPDGIADVDGAQVIATLSGGGCGFISLGRYYPAGDAVWAEAFGTLGSERCDVIDPAEGERAQLEALRRQAEGFAEFAAGAPCPGATADDAIAALTAAEQVTAAIPAMASP